MCMCKGIKYYTEYTDFYHIELENVFKVFNSYITFKSLVYSKFVKTFR